MGLRTTKSLGSVFWGADRSTDKQIVARTGLLHTVEKSNWSWEKTSQVPKYCAGMEQSDIIGSQCQLAKKPKPFWGLDGNCYHNLLFLLAKMQTELSKRVT